MIEKLLKAISLNDEDYTEERRRIQTTRVIFLQY